MMNDKLIILFFCLFCSNAWAQMPELFTQIDESLCDNMQAEICFEAEDFTDVAGFQFSISWDDTKVLNPEMTQTHSALGNNLLPNITNTRGSFIWDDTFNPITLADGEYIFCLKFDLVAPLEAVPFNFGDAPTPRLVTTGSFPNTNEQALITNDGFLTCATVPLELSRFKVEQYSRTSFKIEWATNSEANHDYFVLERTHNGNDFSPIAQIEGKGAENNGRIYEYIDLEPYVGNNYYRLKQVSFTKEVTYSEVIAAKFSLINSSLQLYPNPARDWITLSYHSDNSVEGDLNVEIYNLMGVRVFKSQNITFEGKGFQKNYDISFLPNGQYFLLMLNANAEIIESKKVFIF